MPNIEEHIRRAMEEGKFDDLPGKGKPLQWDENPFEDPDWMLAHHILKNGGFTLPWLLKRKEIEADVNRARSNLLRSWIWRLNALRRGDSEAGVVPEWERAVRIFRDQTSELNRRIRDYNLEAPAGKFQLPLIASEREIEILIQGKAQE